MGNTMLDFYIKNKVTSGHMDMTGYDEYIKKREKLYRQLGIPLLAFRGAEILEK